MLTLSLFCINTCSQSQICPFSLQSRPAAGPYPPPGSWCIGRVCRGICSLSAAVSGACEMLPTRLQKLQQHHAYLPEVPTLFLLPVTSKPVSLQNSSSPMASGGLALGRVSQREMVCAHPSSICSPSPLHDSAGAEGQGDRGPGIYRGPSRLTDGRIRLHPGLRSCFPVEQKLSILACESCSQSPNPSVFLRWVGDNS